ncbi:ABC transporter permease subunit [Roseomonas sp. E05]|uniref:ABC transporter permease n=1 Tax=Roseomonas sp. E05 TaxID=3046310 RepID=UPI0024B9DBD2|nr:ABC transporter permease subunit [Roseomonas sp. E05]MDJ0391110.1 ABC transporter permease subunit [Roseomonas sp. E05]
MASGTAPAPRLPGLSAAGSFGRAALTVLPFLTLAALWQAGSTVLPPYLLPPVTEILGRAATILTTGELLGEVLATVARTLGGLAGAFLLGGLLAALMGRSRLTARLLSPLLTFLQGIPALSWVVFAVIWFRGTEVRIFFIMLVTTLPAFTFQLLDAYRSIPRDLAEMVASFRPRRWQMFSRLVWPAVLPGILTAWKVNLGNASRVVVVAELVGATGGVGYELLQQQQLFDMAGAMAWTLQLVLFVLLVQWAISAIEAAAFRYRAVSERAL